MRSLAFVAILALALLAPAARASPDATLALAATPETLDVSNGTAPAQLLVTLTLHDIACVNDQDFYVTLDPSARDGASIMLDAARAVFTVPSGSYAFDDYQAQQWIGMNVTGAGNITVHAHFESDGGDGCIAPGGLPTLDAYANLTAFVGEAPPASPPPTEPTPATPTPAPTPTPTPPTPASPTPATPPSPTASGPAANNTTGAVDQLPPGGGYVGDYKPAESKSPVPAPGVGLGLAVVAAAAVLLRRARR